MKLSIATAAVLLCCWQVTTADIYLHNPRGSNNRFNARSAQTQNQNRVFDSQNNKNGGYNMGENMATRARTDDQFYRMLYFQSGSGANEKSLLTLDYSVQHGCDTDELSCQVIIQMLCHPNDESHQVREGTTEQTNDFQRPNQWETLAQLQERRQRNVRSERAQHESWDWYNECGHRQRNLGLFTAERRLQTVWFEGEQRSPAIFTRQNNKGKRYGYECPEERDYYPYFTPDPWKDIAVLTDHTDRCDYYRENSFSGENGRGTCVGDDGRRLPKHFSVNNATGCSQIQGQWIKVFNYLEKLPETSENACLRRGSRAAGTMWAVPYDAANYFQPECLVQIATPECLSTPGTRSNHHGNARDSNENPRYSWTLPYFPSGTAQRCVLRVRYNITSYDTDPYDTDYTENQADPRAVRRHYQERLRKESEDIRRLTTISWPEKREMIEQLRQELTAQATAEVENNVSPIQTDPELSIAPGFPRVQFATQADQMGRVFQDRSHVFHLAPRPAEFRNRRLFNLNVKGKRGNIVQTYPAIEYDFHPNRLQLTEQDLVHIQWTGSNQHIGDGEGRQGTDRSNMVQVENLGVNYPVANRSLSLWSNARVFWTEFDGVEGVPMVTPTARSMMSVHMETSLCHGHNKQSRELNECSYRVLGSEDELHDRNIGHRLQAERVELTHDSNPPSQEQGSGGSNQNPAPSGQGFSDYNSRPIRRPFRPRRPGRGKRSADTMFGTSVSSNGLTDENLALAFLTGGRYWCLASGNCPSQIPGIKRAPAELNERTDLNPTLDQARASFPGVVMSIRRGTYHFISSRNNNFSNRMQKGIIAVN